MAPRGRKEINRSLPPHTRVRAGYYSWTNPVTGIEHGLGRHRGMAISQAIQANAHIALQQPSLIDRITGVKSWGDWLDKYEKILAARPLKDTTARSYKSLMGKARALWPATAIQRVTTAMVADALDEIIEAGKARTAQALRSFLMDSFREAIAQGWVERNPVEPTRGVSVKVNRSRLTLEVFNAVLEAEQTLWAKNAYALAIVSGQSRESIVGAQFADFKDGHWFNERGKTGARIALPLDLRLDCVGLSLADVVKRCRSTGVLSRYLIHQTQDYGNSKRGAQIWLDTLSRHFTDTLATLGLSFGDKRPPTLHEIRSLSERLYFAQGNVNTQELLGHKDPATTALYHDSRGEWVKVSIRK